MPSFALLNQNATLLFRNFQQNRIVLVPYFTIENITHGGHGTGKTGNLDVNFSRQGKHREILVT